MNASTCERRRGQLHRPGLEFAALGLEFAALGLAFTALGLTFAALGLAFAALGLAFAALGLATLEQLQVKGRCGTASSRCGA
eukprot:49346-Pyramimonas_sp.AAC.1